MTLEKIVTPKLEIELFNKKWNCEFKIRNFAVLEQEYNVSSDALLKGLIAKEILYVAYAIWASTLVFAPFDAANPLKVDDKMDLQEILTLSLVELQAACDQVVKAMHAYLPQQSEAEKAKAAKKPKTAVKKTAKTKTNMN